MSSIHGKYLHQSVESLDLIVVAYPKKDIRREIAQSYKFFNKVYLINIAFLNWQHETKTTKTSDNERSKKLCEIDLKKVATSSFFRLLKLTLQHESRHTQVIP